MACLFTPLWYFVGEQVGALNVVEFINVFLFLVYAFYVSFKNPSLTRSRKQSPASCVRLESSLDLPFMLRSFINLELICVSGRPTFMFPT